MPDLDWRFFIGVSVLMVAVVAVAYAWRPLTRSVRLRRVVLGLVWTAMGLWVTFFAFAWWLSTSDITLD